MPTDVITKIGVTNSPVVMDYSTLQSWEDACPANLVTDDKRWIGECYDQGAFTGVTTLLTISGITTDSTRSIILRCATGASFNSKNNIRTVPLNYDEGRGVAIRHIGPYTSTISIAVENVLLSDLQIKTTANGGNCIYGNNITLNIQSCICWSVSNDMRVIRVDGGLGTLIIKNSLLLTGSSNGYPILINYELKCYGCTIIRIGATTSKAIRVSYGRYTIKNTAIFNFSTVLEVNTATNSGSGYNATSSSSAPGSNNQANLTFASQFVSTTTDFRTIGAGGTNSGGLKLGTPDLTNTPTDITGQDRDTVTPYIGCWEPLPLWLQASSLVVKSKPWGNVQPQSGASVNWGDPISQGLVGCWPLNEGAGLLSRNIVRSNSHVITGNSTWGINKFGKMLTFDGTNTYINTLWTPPVWPMLTFSAWLQPNNVTGSHTIITSDSTLFFRTNGAAVEIIIVGLSTDRTSGGTMTIGKQYHLVGTFTGSSLNVYINAVQVNSVATSGVYTSPTNPFMFGNRPALDRAFDGFIDSVRVYNRALRHSEIYRLYAEPFAGITEPKIRLRNRYNFPPNSYSVFKPSILKSAR